MKRAGLFLFTACALLGCRRPNLPSALTPVTLQSNAGRSFELQREVEGVGMVTERVISREPAAVRDGACAGQMELAVPGAPGGDQRYLAHVGCPGGVVKVSASRRDSQTGRLWLYEPTLDQMMRARSLVLSDRSDGAVWFVRDALHDARSWTGVVHALGHTHPELPSDEGVPRQARQLVVLLGMYAGYPAAGSQWDDVQVAILDENGDPLARLTLDPMEMGTHAALQLRNDKDGHPSELAYVGMLRDATGAWRFVDLSILVTATQVEKPTGLGSTWNDMVTTRRTHVLSHLKDGALGHLWVDGVEWMGVDEVGGLLDEVVHQPTSMLGGDLSINPAPEDAPLWMVAQASTGTARMAYDVGLMGDTFDLLPACHGASVRVGPTCMTACSPPASGNAGMKTWPWTGRIPPGPLGSTCPPVSV